eukprot:7712015-Ditylum_brightwellii.AAC.1
MPMSTTTTTAALKFYCDMQRPNRTHNTKDCFELKRRDKRAKADMTRGGANKVFYKDLNNFVNVK